MQASDYELKQLQFAYAYHAYLHWRTHRRKPYQQLTDLDQLALHALGEPLGLHVLECNSQPTECRALVSLRPGEALSACASKLKGQVSKWLPDEEPQPWWHAEHACTHLQFHIVMATAGRRGVFGVDEGAAVTARWVELQRERRFALRKTSFVSDHVHLALWLHPAVAPAIVVVDLMNEAQRLLAERFAGVLVPRG